MINTMILEIIGITIIIATTALVIYVFLCHHRRDNSRTYSNEELYFIYKKKMKVIFL